MVAQILLVFAFVFGVIAALFVEALPAPPIRVHFGWLALTFYVLSVLLSGWK